MRGTKRQLTNGQIEQLVKGLIDSHKKLGWDKLSLAVWFGAKEDTSQVHLLEVFERLPESVSGELETLTYAPSADFPATLHVVAAAPADIENALKRRDPRLRTIVSTDPRVLVCDKRGKALWERVQRAFAL